MNLAMAFLIGLCFGVIGGYVWHGDRDAESIRTAESSYAVCNSALAGNETALADVRKQLAELRERHDAAKNAAADVLEARDAENAVLTERVAALTEILRKTAYADASCAPLARLAVCSAVAGRLWPVAGEAAEGHHAD